MYVYTVTTLSGITSPKICYKRNSLYPGRISNEMELFLPQNSLKAGILLIRVRYNWVAVYASVLPRGVF